MHELRVNGQRLWQSLMTMAEIGATAKGGVNRQTLTDEDKRGRDLFRRWCEEAGCAVTIDRIGNIFARRPGRNPELPPVVTGSHLDTQPTGGRFDGAYGVMAGLEVVRTLNDLGYETEAPIEIVAWTNEEGSRFSPAMVGSGVFAGVFELDRALALDCRIIGIYNRNLKTFVTTLETTEQLAPRVPKGRIVIAESGIADNADIQRLNKAGVNAFLVGESLMRQPDVTAATRALLGSTA